MSPRFIWQREQIINDKRRYFLKWEKSQISHLFSLIYIVLIKLLTIFDFAVTIVNYNWWMSAVWILRVISWLMSWKELNWREEETASGSWAILCYWKWSWRRFYWVEKGFLNFECTGKWVTDATKSSLNGFMC